MKSLLASTLFICILGTVAYINRSLFTKQTALSSHAFPIDSTDLVATQEQSPTFKSDTSLLYVFSDNSRAIGFVSTGSDDTVIVPKNILSDATIVSDTSISIKELVLKDRQSLVTELDSKNADLVHEMIEADKDLANLKKLRKELALQKRNIKYDLALYK